jgi:hypothetical protein
MLVEYLLEARVTLAFLLFLRVFLASDLFRSATYPG